MSKNYENCVRGFHRPLNAWYGISGALHMFNNPNIVDSFTIGFYCPDGSTPGEFEINWIKLGGSVVPQLRAFDDAWGILVHFQDLLSQMAQLDDINVKPDKFQEVLLSCNIQDLTKYTRG